MKKCGDCFRFVENWRDAKEKGYSERCNGFREYHYKPRKGIKTYGIGTCCHNKITANSTGCKHWEHRWWWNIKTWYKWHFEWSLQIWWRKNVRVPVGVLRKPITLKWQDSYNGMTDTIIPDGEPVCPICGEMPYSVEQCVFCGQRFR